MRSFFLDNTTLDLFLIRPSGNPLDAKGSQDMWSSGDLVLQSPEIAKLHKFELLGSNAAICVFTLGSKLTYIGLKTINSLQSLQFIKKIEEQYKVAWM